jgi:hypothetical protein
VLAITFMVAALVCSFSYVYVSEMLRQRVTFAHDTAGFLSNQLGYVAANAIPDMTSTLRGDASNPAKVRPAITSYLATNRELMTILESVVTDWPMVQDAAIVDADGRAILHIRSDMVNQIVPDRPDFRIVQDAKFRQQLWLVYHEPTLYDMRLPLRLNGELFGSIRLGISTVFIRNDITPRLKHAVIFCGISILLSLLLAVGLSYIALGPPGTNQPVADGQRGDDEPGLVTLNIAHL